MSKRKKKSLIVVAYASTGSGHQKAAEAIVEQLHDSKPSSNIILVDILEYYSGKLNGNDFVSATSGFLAPAFDVAWRKNFTGRVLWSGGKYWPSCLYKKFEDYIKKTKPDAVICTHFICANAAAKARLSMEHYFPIVCVPTDYETEGLWPHKEADLFCVANKEMRITLLARNIDDNKIVVSGIPLCRTYKKQYDKDYALSKFKLPKDKKIAVIVAGANLPGPYKNVRKVINGCIDYFAKMNWIHFVVCVGKDEKYANKVNQLIEVSEAKNISICNYSQNMTQLLTVADIALIKPGGLITTECAYMGIPIILVGKTYAQEDANRRFLTLARAAEHATTYKGVVNLLCDIFSNEDLYNTLKKNTLKLCRNNASEIIVNKTFDLIENPPSPSHNFGPLYIGDAPVHTR